MTVVLIILVLSIINMGVGFALARYLQYEPVEMGELEIQSSVESTNNTAESTNDTATSPEQASADSESAPETVEVDQTDTNVANTTEDTADNTSADASAQDDEPAPPTPEADLNTHPVFAEPELDDVIPPAGTNAVDVPQPETPSDAVVPSNTEQTATSNPVVADDIDQARDQVEDSASLAHGSDEHGSDEHDTTALIEEADHAEPDVDDKSAVEQEPDDEWVGPDDEAIDAFQAQLASLAIEDADTQPSETTD